MQRIINIKNTVKGASDRGLDIDKEKLVGMMCVDLGASRRTALEYITNLVSADYIIEKEDAEKRTILKWNYTRAD